jgi:gluconolactonase
VETLLEIRDPDGATLDRQHRLIVCLSTLRKLIAVEPSGQYTVLAETYDGKRLNSVNDVVLGPDGALYFTDPTIDVPKGETTELPTAVYRMEGTTLTPLTTDLAQPNGLAFSPDGKRLYVTDTQRREIRAFDVVMKNGTVELANNRLFGKEEGTGGVPDGLKVDANGNLFVTGPLGVWVWDADGHHLGTIVLPETPANLAWGDADRSTLYFTAKSSVYRLKTKTRAG